MVVFSHWDRLIQLLEASKYIQSTPESEMTPEEKKRVFMAKRFLQTSPSKAHFSHTFDDIDSGVELVFASLVDHILSRLAKSSRFSLKCSPQCNSKKLLFFMGNMLDQQHVSFLQSIACAMAHLHCSKECETLGTTSHFTNMTPIGWTFSTFLVGDIEVYGFRPLAGIRKYFTKNARN